MERALSEAQKGWGRVSPNPLVGCTILDSAHQFLASGAHLLYGTSHAEVDAIQKVSPEKLVGAHVVVTLEPCSHYGKTPPCANMLAKLPIESVTYGVLDPNPLVSGKGIEILNQAGKKTIHLESYEQKCRELAENFLHFMIYKKPFVALKVAMTEDEAIGVRDSKERVILSNETSLIHVHYLRAQYDAILVGKNTILKDNPKLNIRHPDFLNKKNKIIILDPKGELIDRKDLEIFKYHSYEDVFFVTQEMAGPQILSCPLNPQGDFDLNALMLKLGDMKIQSVFVEGGAHLYRSFVQQKAVQRFYIYKTPHRLFEKGLNWTLDYKRVEELQLQNLRSQSIGDNLFLTGVCDS